jgi:outer membrane protein OmpU
MKALPFVSFFIATFASSALAEVKLTGEARLGVIGDFGADSRAFSSRVRVKFEFSGKTDGGLAFGASSRADLGERANLGTAGSVFISGSFGTLSMGDVDGAADAAIGHVSGVGFTGLRDQNESAFISNSRNVFGSEGVPAVLYEYSTGKLTFYGSATNTGNNYKAYSAAAKYDAGNYSFAIGYESFRFGEPRFEQLVVGSTAVFGDLKVKAIYGKLFADSEEFGDQYAVSLDYTVADVTLTAFVADSTGFSGVESIGPGNSFGLGASYDLSSGAKIVSGYVRNREFIDEAFDLGIQMNF